MLRRLRGPGRLRFGSGWRAAKRMGAGLFDDTITDWAAALTYYSVLSLFPGIIVLSAVLGLLGDAATNSLVDTLADVGPGSSTSLVVDAIEELRQARSLAGPAAGVGLALALWTASGYIGAFMRAANSLHKVEEERPMWKTLPLRVGLTVVIVLLVAVCAVGVVLTGSVAERVGRWVGAGSAAVTVWDVAKWPVLAMSASLAIALLYWSAPNARFRWLSPGSVLAVLLWLAASGGFAVYVANFGSYNKTYGSLAGAVVFLVWLWITNVAVLLGAQLDAELART
ncbi:MAG: YihY/virulence factor BrkB family protein [Mycobacteriaceae bacterium]|nr:YihY/virulence factor BrkB family protein [Mycobacteriaceae bacterium]